MTIREIFARNLRQLRHAKALSQETLAHEAKMDRTYVSALERGLYAASIETVADLAQCLDVEPYQMLIPRLSVVDSSVEPAEAKRPQGD
ncbi:MAG: helix-turn-helix transcriptional regulator [Sphingomonadaceae bacterium]|nr:helix-turn-helix transcriptional regulator [Sphingomonadaceae bacterium]